MTEESIREEVKHDLDVDDIEEALEEARSDIEVVQDDISEASEEIAVLETLVEEATEEIDRIAELETKVAALTAILEERKPEPEPEPEPEPDPEPEPEPEPVVEEIEVSPPIVEDKKSGSKGRRASPIRRRK